MYMLCKGDRIRRAVRVWWVKEVVGGSTWLIEEEREGIGKD